MLDVENVQHIEAKGWQRVWHGVVQNGKCGELGVGAQQVSMARRFFPPPISPRIELDMDMGLGPR